MAFALFVVGQRLEKILMVAFFLCRGYNKKIKGNVCPSVISLCWGMRKHISERCVTGKG